MVNIMESTFCPCCLKSSFKPLINFGELPQSGTFLIAPHQSYRKINLSFEFCTNCAFIRRTAYSASPYNYENVNRTTGHRLPEYAGEIVQTLQLEGVKSSDLIVEVGANDGAFLDLLSRSHFDDLLGVEPSVSCAKICRSKGHKIEAIHLNPAEATRIREMYGSAKAVICRHIIEHVPDPVDLLEAIKILLGKDGILFIETPDACTIIRDLHGHELWDEHICSFTSDNLTLIAHQAGLALNNIFVRPYRSAMNILMYCSLGLQGNKSGVFCPRLPPAVELCKGFKERWAIYSDTILAKLAVAPKPIVAFGASHPQSNFLLYTGAGGCVDYIIDDDPFKYGKYVVVPMPVPILSTNRFLDNIVPGTILRTAFGYEGWMDKVCRSFDGKGVLIIDPYL